MKNDEEDRMILQVDSKSEARRATERMNQRMVDITRTLTFAERQVFRKRFSQDSAMLAILDAADALEKQTQVNGVRRSG